MLCSSLSVTMDMVPNLPVLFRSPITGEAVTICPIRWIFFTATYSPCQYVVFPKAWHNIRSQKDHSGSDGRDVQGQE